MFRWSGRWGAVVRAGLLSAAVGALPVCAAAQEAVTQPTPPGAAQDEAARVTNIAGRWELSWRQSDKPPENTGTQGAEGPGAAAPPGGGRGRMGGLLGGMSGGPGAGGPPDPKKQAQEARAREQVRELIEAPRTLTIEEHPDYVVLTDQDGVAERLAPTGTRVVEDRYGQSVERLVRWDGRSLVAEVTLPDKTRVTRTFLKVAEGLQLIVTTRVEGGRYKRALELKRVYDQALQ